MASRIAPKHPATSLKNAKRSARAVRQTFVPGRKIIMDDCCEFLRGKQPEHAYDKHAGDGEDREMASIHGLALAGRDLMAGVRHGVLLSGRRTAPERRQFHIAIDAGERGQAMGIT
jgi:hypothetical protein